MKNKTKKILATACLGLVGMGCLAGCKKKQDYYELTVINDSQYGIISPVLNNDTNSVTVDRGDDYTFTITPKEGYEIDNLIIDGKLVEPQIIYTFTDIVSDHSIGAVYSPIIVEDIDLIESLNIVGIDATYSLFNSNNTSLGNKEMGDAVALMEIYQDRELQGDLSWIDLEDWNYFCKEKLNVSDFFEYRYGEWRMVSNEKNANFNLTSKEVINFAGQDEIKIVFTGYLEGSSVTINRNNLKFVGNAYHDVYCCEVQDSIKIVTVSNFGDGDDLVVLELSNVKLYFTANYCA